MKIFRNVAGTWTQMGSDLFGSSSDYMGTSVSLSEDGNTLAASYEVDVSQGKVRVYQYGVSWSQVGSDIVGEASGDKFGYSVSLSNDGSKLAVGAYGNNSSTGHARVLKYSGGSWSQIGFDIDAASTGDESGTSVGLNGDGNVVVIGAPKYLGDAGYAGVYSICGEDAPGIVVYYRPSVYGDKNISTNGGSDGSIRTMVVGGTGPYTYSWTGPTSISGDSGTGLTEGSYFLEVTGLHGCKGTGGPWYLSEPLPVPP